MKSITQWIFIWACMAVSMAACNANSKASLKQVDALQPRTVRAPECGVESYNTRAEALCGVLAYNTIENPVCGVAEYNSGRGDVCGVEAWNSRHDCGVCGRPHPTAGCRQCANSAFGVASYNSCVNEQFGARRYNACSRPEFGVQQYNSCTRPEFGVAQYRECSLSKTTGELTEYLSATPEQIRLYSTQMTRWKGIYYSETGNELGLGCTIKRYTSDPLYQEIVIEIRQKFTAIFHHEPSPTKDYCSQTAAATGEVMPCDNADQSPKCVASKSYFEMHSDLLATKSNLALLRSEIVAASDASLQASIDKLSDITNAALALDSTP